MTPLYFGHGARRLLGVYSPPQGNAAGTRAVVLCHPWGQEYFRAHRSLRQLAATLSAAGYHVLRFDYFGTGDSSGDMVDADVGGWVGDIIMAMEELRDTTGAARVGLIGLRLGATLAAMAAARVPRQVDSLVLWDPIVFGRDYLKELLGMRIWTPRGLVTPPARPAAAGGGHEINGFPMTTAMSDELEAIELPPLIPNLPARLLPVVSAPNTALDALARALQERPAGPLLVAEVPCLPAWLEDRDTGAGAVPVPLIQRIVQWLG